MTSAAACSTLEKNMKCAKNFREKMTKSLSQSLALTTTSLYGRYLLQKSAVVTWCQNYPIYLSITNLDSENEDA